MKHLITSLIVIALFSACKGPYGLGPIESGIGGEISFINQHKRPADIESLRVVALVKAPPEELGDVIFTYSGLDLSKEQIDYFIPAPKTRYDLVAVIFKRKEKAWDYKNIVGFYGLNPVDFEFEYKPVTLTSKQPTVYNIDIVCDWSFVPAQGD